MWLVDNTNKNTQFAIKINNRLNLNNLSNHTYLRHATFWERLMAYNIDFTILVLTLIPVRFTVEENGFFYIISFALIFIYHVVLESSSKRGTIGKMYSRLTVINLDGSQLSILKASLRFLLKIVSAFPVFLGFTMIGFNRRNQAFHDYLLGTVVEKIDRKNENYPIPKEK